MKLFERRKIKKSHFLRVTIIVGLLGFGALSFIFMNIFFTSSNTAITSSLNNDITDNATSAHRYNDIKGPSPTNHSHSSLFILVNDKLLDLSSEDFQNQDLLMHFEKNDSVTLHQHDRREWLGPFFESLNMSFSKSCFIINNKQSFCNNFNNELRFFVNGKPNSQFQHYTPRNNDTILIAYVNKNISIGDLKSLLGNMTTIKLYAS